MNLTAQLFLSRILPALAGKIAAAAGLFLIFSTNARSATVLGVDFGAGASNVQSGYSGFTSLPADGANATSQSYVTSQVLSGAVNVTLAGGSGGVLDLVGTQTAMNQRDRTIPANSGLFTQNLLMRERIITHADTGNADGMYLQLAGLNPNTQYILQLWAMDWNGAGAKAGTVTFTNFTNGGAGSLIGSYTSTLNQLPTDNNTFSVTATLGSNAAGQILIRSASSIDGVGLLNGFLLNTPEPGKTGLGILALAPALLRRKRR